MLIEGDFYENAHLWVLHFLHLISRKICVAKMSINNCTRTEVGETSYLLWMSMDFSTD